MEQELTAASDGAEEPSDSDFAWSQWFDVQQGLAGTMDALLDAAGSGRSDSFKTALVGGLLEHLAERLRSTLHLPATDEREGS